MKRSLAILLLLCTLFALCACPGGGPVTPPDGPGGNGGKCPTCGKDPCECPEDGVCKNCGGVGCDVCDPSDPVPIEYVTKYPYTETDADGMITAVHMTYQDTWTFPSSIRSMETVEITSFVCGTQEKDNDVLVIQPDGKTVYADGCGTVDVKFLGQYTVRVVVHPAPLNLLFVTGQSNAVADSSFLPTTDPENYNKYHHTYADYYPRTKAGKAYFTWTGQGLSIATGNGSKKPAECVPDTLDWELANRTFGWCRPDQFSLPVGQTTFSGAGWCSALANEWVAETNETVWIVNASHGGRAINTFLPSEDGTHIDNEYYQAVEVFNEALATLYREVDAGHFVLNHMAYYWYQGCADFTRTEDYYAEQLAKVHTAMQADVVYDHAGIKHTLEYCGLMTVRSKMDDEGNSVSEILLNGPRLAQYTAAGEKSGVFSNVFIASSVNEQWVGGDENVEQYFLSTYGSAKKFKEKFGYDMPTTMFEVHPQVHYLIKGYVEMGMDCARNSLRAINLTQPSKNYRLSYEEEELSVTLVGRDGFTPYVDEIWVDPDGSTVLLPRLNINAYTALGLSLRSETEGFAFRGYHLTCSDPTKRQISFSVWLGNKKLASYTMAVRYVSDFMSHQPTYTENAIDGSDPRFGAMSAPWSLGYVTFANGSYKTYGSFLSGWLSPSDATNPHNSATASFRKGTWNASLQPTSLAAPAICYEAETDGTIGIMASHFGDGTAQGVYLAVLVNGEMVWPKEGGRLNGAKNDWYFTANCQDTAASLNLLWEDVSIDVTAGDLVQFCLGRDENTRVTVNGGAQLYPIVYYKD